MIEVLVSILLFSFGLLGLVGLQSRATQHSIAAEDTNRAALLANEIASTMWTERTVNLPTGTVAAWNARVADTAGGGLPGGAGTVVVAGNIASITVTWRPPSTVSGVDHRYLTQVLLP